MVGPKKERESKIREVEGTGRLRLGSHVNRPQQIMAQVKGQMSQSGSERGQSSGHAQRLHWELIERSITVQSCLTGLQKS